MLYYGAKQEFVELFQRFLADRVANLVNLIERKEEELKEPSMFNLP